MKIQKATYAVCLDERRGKKDKCFPLKLRITYKRDRRYYGIGRDITQEEWHILQNNKARGILKDLKTELGNIESKAREVIDSFDDNEEEFSFVRFEQLFFNENAFPKDVYKAFTDQISQYKENGQISNSDSYKCAQKSLFDFLGDKRYQFKDIDSKLLSKYEKWMLENAKSISTIGIYLRNLRSLFNIALRENVIKPEQYPFGKNKYTIPMTESSDKGIPKQVIAQIYRYKPEEFTNEDMAKDLWFFMYLCNGMNVKDVCRLRYSNIQNDVLVYKRAKTERANKKAKFIPVLLNPVIESLIEKWRDKEQNSKEDYLFPFFFHGLTPEDERRISQNLTGVINDWMKRIARKLGIDMPVTTYSARHSHSNILKEENAPIRLIADNLGHSTTAITERHYLTAGFDKEIRREFADKLLSFGKKGDG